MSDKTIRHLIADIIYEKELQPYEDAFDTAWDIAKALKLHPSYDADTLSPVEPEVNQATCGFCKDCKFWDNENVECTNDVIFINKEIATGYISDFKTQNFFGCIKFESKLSG